MLQTAVEIVKPGGTGSPALVISARPDPLPPRRSFMWRLPSALPDPKKNTCFFDFAGLVRGARFMARVFFFAIGHISAVSGWCDDSPDPPSSLRFRAVTSDFAS